MKKLYKPRPDRWPRFSLRSVFALVTVLALFLGWSTTQLRWISQRQEALRQFRAVPGGTPPWSIRLFGATGCKAIYLDDKEDSDPQLARTARDMQRLFPEAALI